MMKLKFILYKGRKVCYSIGGTGNTVMLVHGFGEDGTIWKNQVEGLQKDYSLIVPDIPGSSSSEFIAGADIDIYADVLKQILDEENINTCCMIGHSMGGYITLAFAEKYPAYVKAFGLFHSTAYADSEEKKQARNKSIEFIKQNGSYEFLKATIPNLFYNQQHPCITELVEKGKAILPETLIQYYEAMIKRPDRAAVLQNTKCPVLFIIGKHDKAVPYEQSLAQCHVPDVSHIHILQGDAHMGMVESAENSLSYLISFISFLYPRSI